MRARKEMQDEEDERSATRIGQDRRTGDYRGRGFPGDERRSPAGFHLIPSWLTTDSPLPLSSSLSIPCTYFLSFCHQPFTSADVLLCLFLSLSTLYGKDAPSSFYPPRLINPQLSFSLSSKHAFLVSRRFSFHVYLSRFLHFSRSLFRIYDSPFSHRVRPLCVISFSPSLSSALYSDCISVIRLHVCSRPAPTIQHPRMMPERKFGDFCRSICLRFSLFTVTN